MFNGISGQIVYVICNIIKTPYQATPSILQLSFPLFLKAFKSIIISSWRSNAVVSSSIPRLNTRCLGMGIASHMCNAKMVLRS